MTEDDWRWHAYDTVSLDLKFSMIEIETHLYCLLHSASHRSRDLIGLEIKIVFITCVEKLVSLHLLSH
jgi:hypothetical protein